MTLAQQRLCQRIQDEQGYLIIGAYGRIPIGTVLRWAEATFRSGVVVRLPPLLVIGYATPAEYQAQHVRYDPQHRPWRFGNVGAIYFHKAVAE